MSNPIDITTAAATARRDTALRDSRLRVWESEGGSLAPADVTPGESTSISSSPRQKEPDPLSRTPVLRR